MKTINKVILILFFVLATVSIFAQPGGAPGGDGGGIYVGEGGGIPVPLDSVVILALLAGAFGVNLFARKKNKNK
jgi:hypothetical protein